MQCFDRIGDERSRFYTNDIELSIRESRINAFGEHINSRDLIYLLGIRTLADGSKCCRRVRFDRPDFGHHFRRVRVLLLV
jgi:hypothetical protein